MNWSNKIKGSTTSARRASRSTAFGRFSPSEDSFSRICITSDFKNEHNLLWLNMHTFEALFMQMRIKVCYGHQTNISLTILPFNHSHNHGKHLNAPHSECHHSDLSFFIRVNISMILFFIYLSHQACGRRKPVPSFCHSQHNPIMGVFFMWWDECVISPKEPRSQHIDEALQLCSTKEFEIGGASDWQTPRLGVLMLLLAPSGALIAIPTY